MRGFIFIVITDVFTVYCVYLQMQQMSMRVHTFQQLSWFFIMADAQLKIFSQVDKVFCYMFSLLEMTSWVRSFAFVFCMDDLMSSGAWGMQVVRTAPPHIPTLWFSLIS